MRVENWSVVERQPEPYMAPEAIDKLLRGEVFGSNKFEDGTKITTTCIMEIGNGVCKTASGSEYFLGSVDPDYLKAFPNAKDKLAQHHKKCRDCGVFVKKELWVKKGHQLNKQPLCKKCLSEYESDFY